MKNSTMPGSPKRINGEIDDLDDESIPLVKEPSLATDGEQNGELKHHVDLSSSSASITWLDSIRRKFLIPIIVIVIITAGLFLYEDENISTEVESFGWNENKTIDDVSTINLTDKAMETSSNISESIVDSVVDNTPIDSISAATTVDTTSLDDLLEFLDVNVSSEPFNAIDISEMKENFAAARKAMIDQLKIDYGDETFTEMFLAYDKNFQGKYVFKSPSDEGRSWDRTKKRMMMKILQVQIQQKVIPFVWATGGHSATAGHGNFFDESYTAYLERAAFPAFKSVGLELVARNYAMGGTASAPEVAFCSKEIFGQDIDIIVWDFGMTDGRRSEKLFLYLFRTVGYHKNRPIGIAYHTGGSQERFRSAVMQVLEDDLGLPVLQSSETVMNAVLDKVPDTAGKTAEEIEKMPLFVQNFKCNNEIEKGEPFCNEKKFNTTFCPARKFRNSWHPGWRWQAVMGNLAAMFLIEVIEEALKAIQDEQRPPLDLYNDLKAREDYEYTTFLKKSKFHSGILNQFFEEQVPDSLLAALTKGNLYCHIARLPAETRYKGFLTASNRTGTTTYDVGMGLQRVRNAPIIDGLMPLVFDESEREDCPITTIMDYKDFFYVSSNEEWMKLTVPNRVEERVYGTNESVSQGVIGFCLTACSWGKCPNGVLTREDFLERKFEFKVNGEPVSSLKKMSECEILVNGAGTVLWKPNTDGRFTLEAKVHTPNSYIRISALIVWPLSQDTAAAVKLGFTEATPSPSPEPAKKIQIGKKKHSKEIPVSGSSSASYVSSVRGNFEKAKEQFINQLKVQYGTDNFERMFMETSKRQSYNRGTKLFQQAEKGLSETRFKRKAMIKLLQVMNNVKTTKKGERVESVPFVWVTGGHSAAAGHGNLYDESYTAVLERSAKGIFESLGLNFTGKNYAMGGTKAAPEVALCSKEIFGQDVDVLIWDFGMTDGSDFEYEILYFYRASLADTGRPACFSFQTGTSPDRWKITKHLDNVGLTSLNSVEDVMKSVLDAIPDSFGLTDEQIDVMPPFVQNFRCGNQIENGDPYCKEKKYNLTICPTRRYQASWHPGWRWHALMGYLATFFLINVFEAALNEISLSTTDPRDLLTTLLAEEDSEYESFWNADVDESLKKMFELDDLDRLDLKLFAKGQIYCHTAKLPAEIRHKGILTESNQTGFSTYDKGIGLSEADLTPNDSELVRLVYSEDERFDCPVPTIMDYKDYFYLHEREGTKKWILPNDSEWTEYGRPKNGALVGMIAMCHTVCPWGSCPQGNLLASDFHDGKYQLFVNEVPVTNLTKFRDCEFLSNDNDKSTSLIWKPNDDGRFVITGKVVEPNSYIRISAVIIW